MGYYPTAVVRGRMTQSGLRQRVFGAGDLLTWLLLASVYVLAGKLGLTLAYVNASATAVWPPAGIALAALLVLGPRAWPGVFLGSFLLGATNTASLATAAGIASG